MSLSSVLKMACLCPFRKMCGLEMQVYNHYYLVYIDWELIQIGELPKWMNGMVLAGSGASSEEGSCGIQNFSRFQTWMLRFQRLYCVQTWRIDGFGNMMEKGPIKQSSVAMFLIQYCWEVTGIFDSSKDWSFCLVSSCKVTNMGISSGKTIV